MEPLRPWLLVSVVLPPLIPLPLIPKALQMILLSTFHLMKLNTPPTTTAGVKNKKMIQPQDSWDKDCYNVHALDNRKSWIDSRPLPHSCPFHPMKSFDTRIPCLPSLLRHRPNNQGHCPSSHLLEHQPTISENDTVLFYLTLIKTNNKETANNNAVIINRKKKNKKIAYPYTPNHHPVHLYPFSWHPPGLKVKSATTVSSLTNVRIALCQVKFAAILSLLLSLHQVYRLVILLLKIQQHILISTTTPLLLATNTNIASILTLHHDQATN